NQGYFLLTPVLTASEAMAAMERSPEPYDLILCDQRLPDLDGLDLIEKAWKRGLIRHAVLLSGLAAQQLLDLEQLAIQLGLPMLGCLSKPLNGPVLVHLLSGVSGSQ
ncbi:response regulator, partial [Pseudomonas viridiflava]|uniref:response regulator n=1 Tax=Pseudomonas viridiflava TaxID=33069 RepID=UPI00177D822B